jgi:hypothetical protein
MTANTELEAKAVKTGRAFSGDVLGAPAGFTLMISAVDFAVGPSHEIIIVGNPEAPDTLTMVQAINDQFIPNKITLLIPTDKRAKQVIELVPFTKDYKTINGKATTYVCTNYVCQNPTTDVEQIVQLLNS